ncbi:MAG: hypothetical protein NTV86_09655, partial [Planctomycetota bacterium]|nr:hypothetical protein [Planctomycetota bacterium]
TMSSLTVLRMGRFFRGLGLLTGMRRPAAQEQAESGPSPASRPAAGNEPPIVMATENLAAAERTVVFVPAGAAADVVEWFKSVIPKPKYPQARQAEDRERQLAEEKVEQAKRAAEESKKQYEERTRLLKEREKALLEELKKSSQGPEPGP